MMPTELDQMNLAFSKLQDMTDEECAPLHVFKGKDTLGMPVIISCWTLSKEDLEEIQRSGKIYLTICGTGMPPVSLQVESPFLTPSE